MLFPQFMLIMVKIIFMLSMLTMVFFVFEKYSPGWVGEQGEWVDGLKTCY